jgi:hypothetical protein
LANETNLLDSIWPQSKEGRNGEIILPKLRNESMGKWTLNKKEVVSFVYTKLQELIQRGNVDAEIGEIQRYCSETTKNPGTVAQLIAEQARMSGAFLSVEDRYTQVPHPSQPTPAAMGLYNRAPAGQAPEQQTFVLSQQNQRLFMAGQQDPYVSAQHYHTSQQTSAYGHPGNHFANDVNYPVQHAPVNEHHGRHSQQPAKHIDVPSLIREGPAKEYRGIISSLEEASLAKAEYMKLRNLATLKPCPDFPESKEIQKALVRELFDAIIDCDQIMDNVKVKKRSAKEMEEDGSAAPEEEEYGTQVKRVMALSALEVEMICWNVLVRKLPTSSTLVRWDVTRC